MRSCCSEAMGTAMLSSSAVRQDGRSASLTAPNGSAQRTLLLLALGSMSATLLGSVEMHGTGTALGDPTEAGALAQAHGGYTRKTPLVAGTAKASGRVEAVVVVLEGPDDAVSGWLTRLRSEYVDVDGRGAKCKERKSTVMCRREMAADSSAQHDMLVGWEASVYEEEGTMETALASLDLLHVGSGSTRWGGAAGAPGSRARPHRGSRGRSTAQPR